MDTLAPIYSIIAGQDCSGVYFQWKFPQFYLDNVPVANPLTIHAENYSPDQRERMTANVPRALGGLHVADLSNDGWHKDSSKETGLIGMGHCGDDVSEKVIFVAMSENNVYPSERGTVFTKLRDSGARGQTQNPAYDTLVFRLDGSSSLGMVLDERRAIASGRHGSFFLKAAENAARLPPDLVPNKLHDTVNNYIMFVVN